MDWIHCNRCYIQPGELPKRQYNLTSCGHIFCVLCEKGDINECKVCRNTCTTTQITGQMPLEVQTYFDDPDVIMRKLIKVMDFQRDHRIRLSEARRMLAIKYQKAKAEIYRLIEEMKKLKRDLDWYRNNFGPMTQNKPPKSGPPLLAQNSQASQAIRATANNRYYDEKEQHQFRAANLSQPSSFSGYRYNYQGTPSDMSTSPASMLSGGSTPQSQKLTPYSQYGHTRQIPQYKAGITPPMSNLNLLSIASQNARETIADKKIESLLKCKKVMRIINDYKKAHPNSRFHVLFSLKRRKTVLIAQARKQS